ncbi:unnamed protein product [Adineta steineri]|uniref:G-protein coupled receptors family 1 profile domain-containing protein n=2 Tax=Adineta steineri TaxID=433720 RepID=A0A819FBK8_9BILA|nr:unnamed protein product [Adineta steineri]
MAVALLVRFWLYLIFVIPSVVCSIFTLYYFLVNRTFRKVLSNHVLILILCLAIFYNITDIMWLIDYYRNGVTFSSLRPFCLAWTYIDFAVFISITFLVAWASIERHILIFHQNFISTKTKRLVVHYLPMIIFGGYPFIYYFVIFFILPCSLSINNKKTRCGLTNCAYENGSTGLYDGIVNNILPIFSIIIFSLALIVRVWYNKYRMGQRFQWKKYRKMTFQLLSISAIYFVLLFPSMLLLTAYSAGLSNSTGADFYSGSLYFSYFVTLLVPFVCIFSFPKLRAVHTVRPDIVTVDHLIGTRKAGLLPAVQ